LCSHPGCVYGGAERRRYNDTFRRFVLDLREQHPDVDPGPPSHGDRFAAPETRGDFWPELPAHS